MIDFIRPTLYQFKLDEPDNFKDKLGNHPNPIDTLTPYPNLQIMPTFGIYKVYVLDQSKVTTFNGYIPNISIKINPNRRNPYMLVIQYSPNKAVNGHNYYELTEDQFEEMIAATVELLKDCGVTINPLDLANCSHIGRIDFGCNMPLTNMALPEFFNILNILEKNNRYQRKDTPYQKEFIPGRAIAFFNKSQRLVFYNKTAEVLNVLDDYSKVATDHYRFAQELKNHLTIIPTEILRVEHRFLTSSAVRRELKPLIMHEPPFTFREVFKQAVRTSVLLKHTDQVINDTSLKTYVLGELAKDAVGNHIETARSQLNMNKPNPTWLEYPMVFRRQGEKSAMQIISDNMPKATSERGFHRWQQMMAVTLLDHPLLKTRDEIYRQFKNPATLKLPLTLSKII
jgi:hypothetical protein